MILAALCYLAAAALLAVNAWMLVLGVREWRRDRGPDALEAQLQEIRALPEWEPGAR
jgi:hypothetical protein